MVRKGYASEYACKKENEEPKLKDECDSCGKIKEVKKYGRFAYCRECKEEIDKRN